MLYFEFGHDRLAQPHPLKAFELARVRLEAGSSPRRLRPGSLSCRKRSFGCITKLIYIT